MPRPRRSPCCWRCRLGRWPRAPSRGVAMRRCRAPSAAASTCAPVHVHRMPPDSVRSACARRATPRIGAAASSISRPRRARPSSTRDEPHARMDQRNERSCRTCSRSSPAPRWISRTTTRPTTTSSRSRRRKEFDLGRYAAGRSKAVRFDRPGIVRVFCEIHSHMSAFILVFAHRYFAVTDDEGRYRLDACRRARTP